MHVCAPQIDERVAGARRRQPFSTRAIDLHRHDRHVCQDSAARTSTRRRNAARAAWTGVAHAKMARGRWESHAAQSTRCKIAAQCFRPRRACSPLCSFLPPARGWRRKPPATPTDASTERPHHHRRLRRTGSTAGPAAFSTASDSDLVHDIDKRRAVRCDGCHRRVRADDEFGGYALIDSWAPVVSAEVCSLPKGTGSVTKTRCRSPRRPAS